MKLALSGLHGRHYVTCGCALVTVTLFDCTICVSVLA